MFETVDVPENLFILYLILLIIPMAIVTEIIMERYNECGKMCKFT